MQNFKVTLSRSTRLIVLGLMLGCFGARSTGVAQQSSDSTKPDLIPYRKGNQWGFSDSSKKLIIPPHYDCVERFSEGLTLALLNGKYGFIDRIGQEVIPFKYAAAGSFSEGLADGLAVVHVNDKAGYLDRSGKLVISPEP